MLARKCYKCFHRVSLSKAMPKTHHSPLIHKRIHLFLFLYFKTELKQSVKTALNFVVDKPPNVDRVARILSSAKRTLEKENIDINGLNLILALYELLLDCLSTGLKPLQTTPSTDNQK